MAKRASIKNAREARAKSLGLPTGDGGGSSVGPRQPDDTPKPEQGGSVLQFNVDQLFAAYGAKEFENTLLKAEIGRLNQVVATYKNLLAAVQNSQGKSLGESENVGDLGAFPD